MESGMLRKYTPRERAFVKRLVASGRYGSASDVLRLLEEGKELPESELKELRRLAAEGEASGLCEEDGEALLDRLEARYRGLADRKPGN
jgi:putative addiction module CopG family antidote